MFDFIKKVRYTLNTKLYYPDIEICENRMRIKAVIKFKIVEKLNDDSRLYQ